MRPLALTCVALALLTGCGGAPKTLSPPAPPSGEGALATAHAKLRARQTREALVDFMALREVDDPALRRRASLGAAQALRAEGNLPGALAVLLPLPRTVETATDAHSCALAGELWLRLKQPEPAAEALERALRHSASAQASWRPAAAFNLGKCALAQGQSDRAQKAFAQARDFYLAQGDRTGAEACDLALEALAPQPRRKEA